MQALPNQQLYLHDLPIPFLRLLIMERKMHAILRRPISKYFHRIAHQQRDLDPTLTFNYHNSSEISSIFRF